MSKRVSNKILVLTPRFPFPIIAGDTLRIINICKVLAKRYDLTLLSMCSSREEMEADPNQDIFDSIHRVYHPTWKAVLNTAAALPSSKPLQLAYYESKAFRKSIDALLPDHDLVLAHLLRAGQFVEKYNGCPCILEMTDALSLNYRRVSDLGKWGLKHLIYRIEKNRVSDYEWRMINHFDLITLVSEVDRQFLLDGKAHAEKEHVKVYTNGINLEQRPYCPPDAAPTIVFIGNMRTVHNRVSCEHFANDILPRIQDHIPGARFRIIGHASDEAMRTFSRIDGVDVTGWVDSIAEASRGAMAGMGVMQVGAGVQNKILEYMALGLPVIANQTGMEGIDAEEGSHFLLGETTNEIVKHFILLHQSQARRKKLAEAARTFVEQNHEWEAVLRGMVQDVEEILQENE